MPPKRKRSSVANSAAASAEGPLQEVPNAHTQSNSTASRTRFPAILPPSNGPTKSTARKRQNSNRTKVDTNPDYNEDIIDGQAALRASPDADEAGESLNVAKITAPITPTKTIDASGIKKGVKVEDDSDSPLSDLEQTPVAKKQKKSPTKSSIAAKKGFDEIKAFRAEQAAKKAAETKVKKEQGGDEWDSRQDPDGDEIGPVEEADVLKLEAGRPPPVNSDYLPIPWKGRLGYVGLETCTPRKLLI